MPDTVDAKTPLRAVVYTADMGGFDETWLFPAQSHIHAYVRFDNAHRNLCPIRGASDRLAARWFKTHPDVLFPGADFTLWIDACLEVTSPTFLIEAAAQSTFTGMGYLRHPDRDNIRDEVVAAAPMAKYWGNRHAEMVDGYERVIGRSIPGLWAMTVIARWNRPSTRLVDHFVWLETLAWTEASTALDQLALPFVLAALDRWPDDLYAPLDGMEAKGDLWRNDWFVRHPHRRDT